MVNLFDSTLIRAWKSMTRSDSTVLVTQQSHDSTQINFR